LLGIGARGRIGYRRNFGAKVALEATLDPGVVDFFVLNGPSSGSSAAYFVGLNIALVFALNRAPPPDPNKK
jgi:hypothetical protein